MLKTVLRSSYQAPLAAAEFVAPIPSLPTELGSSTHSAHIVHLDLTLTRLTALVSSRIDPFVSVDRATAVDELAVQIITTSKALRAESKPGPEEGREQRVKSLATRKRRAWIELLRELKRLGLSPTPTPDVVARLQDSGVVYGLTPSHPVLATDPALLAPSLRTQLIRSDDYHFRLLSELPALRECPASHHEDISTREVQRAIGSIESCIALSFENRNRLLAAVASQVRLGAIAHRLEVVGSAGDVQPSLPSRELGETLLEQVSQVLLALKEAREELVNHRLALGGACGDISSVESAITGAISLLEDDTQRLENALATMAGPVELSTPLDVEAFVSAQEHLSSVIEQLKNSPPPSSLWYIIQPLADWSATLVIPTVHSPSAEDDVVALETLDSSHATLVDSILVIAQELKKVRRLLSRSLLPS